MSGYELLSLGMINALGEHPSEIRTRLFSSELSPHSSLTTSSEHLRDEKCYVGAINSSLPELPNNLQHLDSRFSRILLALYLQMENEINELIKLYNKDKIGIVLGSSTSGIDRAEPAFIEANQEGKFPEWYRFFHQEIGAGSRILSELSGITGPSYTISTACSSSSKVFESAKLLLDLSICDAVILGGVDSLCKMTLRGFKSLDLVSNEPCNPFSVNRCGLTIGEGGALFALVKSPRGVQLCGVGESSDAYHISSPEPDGKGAIAAMEEALKASNKDTSQVRYMNLHGTGTILNDAMESKAVSAFLGSNVHCSSTKPLTGHLLGACGAVEAGFLWMMLNEAGRNKPLPPHIWDETPDPALPSLRLSTIGENISLSRGDIVLSNSFAFGGNNCCLALGLGQELS